METPKEQKPISEMQVIPEPDAPPANLAALPYDQQAAKLFQLYTGMAGYAGTCNKSRDNLIQWINRQ